MAFPRLDHCAAAVAQAALEGLAGGATATPVRDLGLPGARRAAAGTTFHFPLGQEDQDRDGRRDDVHCAAPWNPR